MATAKRVDSGRERDAAELRDRAARARDLAADARDLAMAQLDAASRLEDAPGRPGDTDDMRAAGRHKRTARRNAQTAEHRMLAAEDRERAAVDREQAADERRELLAERETIIAQLREQQRRIDQALRHQHRAEQLARTLQRSLSPPSLPRLAGIEVAVHYEPSAPEDVGGDFYDLFPLARARSGFFLGDVCGKGPEAAAVTSLARYTMRTAAMLHETPDAILMDLNTALMMQDTDPAPSCTAVYGEIDVSRHEATVTLAVGGHPPPMIVRADGSVETTAAFGTMLGVVAEPSFQTCGLLLSPGDAIVICSDGVHDTKIDGYAVDEQRVADLLAGPPDATPRILVERLTRALQSTARPLRDDVAIMALQRTLSG